MIKRLVRKIVEHLFWKFQEEYNWRMKMNEPIVMYPISEEELKVFLEKKRNQVKKLQSI